jgi:hypothetical protein
MDPVLPGTAAPPVAPRAAAAAALVGQRVATARRSFRVLDLRAVFDNDAISTRANPGDGAFNVWGNTLPAESLPESGSLIGVRGVPFRFPPTGDGELNTVVCRGQLLRLPPAHVDWLHLLAASERRTEDTVHVHYADGAVDPEWIRVSDFWPAAPHFGEVLAFRCPVMHYPRHVQPGVEGQIWMTRVPVVRRTPLAALRLPRNVAIHVFALTLEEAAE